MIQMPNVNLNSETPAIKFLGVYFDPSLNFKFHINLIMKKLSRALFFMRTAKNNLSVPEKLFITPFFILILYIVYMYGLVHLPPPMLVSSLNKKWPLDL